MTKAPAFIEFDDVTVQYGDAHATQALSGICLRVHRGEKIGLIGKSGSGKSTLLRLLAGREYPTQGQVLLDGEPMSSKVEGHRKELGWIQQEHPLVAALDVHKNVQSGNLANFSFCKTVLAWIAHVDIDDVNNALSRVGLAQQQFNRVHELSGGERQRVAVARVLFGNASFFLADEPTAALDPKTANDIVDVLFANLESDEEKTGVQDTMVFCTHLFTLIRNKVDRVIGLQKGRVLFDLAPNDVDDALLKSLYIEDDSAADKEAICR